MRPDEGAAAPHIHADGAHLAVAVARIGFDAQQVVAREFGLDAAEDRLSRRDDLEHVASSSRRQRLDALRTESAIRGRCSRPASVSEIEHIVVEMQNVQTGARGCRHPAKIRRNGVGILGGEPFGDEEDRLGRLEQPEATEERRQPLNSLPGLQLGLPAKLLPFVGDVGLAQVEGRPAAADRLALAADHGFKDTRHRVHDPEALGQRNAVFGRDTPAAAVHQRDRVLGLLKVRQERRHRRALTEPHDGHTIGGRQLVDEPGHGPRDERGAAEPDVWLIDSHHDEAAAEGGVVRRETLGRGFGLAIVGTRTKRHPFGADHASGLAADADGEVGRSKVGHRAPATVDHAHVDRDDLDAGAKVRLLGLLPGAHRDRRGHDTRKHDRQPHSGLLGCRLTPIRLWLVRLTCQGN